jgi:L-galactose dehydrogenase
LAGLRHKVILATKCGRYGADDFDFSARTVVAGVCDSLVRLKTDYIDLLQVHDVEFGDVEQIVNETLPALRALQQQGKARYIGITGYSLQTLVSIAKSAPVDSILSYCRYNLMIRDMDTILTPLVNERSIGLINASPLHMGILSQCGAPAWHPAPSAVRAAGRRANEICKAQGLPLTEVALRFCLAQSYGRGNIGRHVDGQPGRGKFARPRSRRRCRRDRGDRCRAGAQLQLCLAVRPRPTGRPEGRQSSVRPLTR